jgi:hypothetical protein
MASPYSFFTKSAFPSSFNCAAITLDAIVEVIKWIQHVHPIRKDFGFNERYER